MSPRPIRRFSMCATVILLAATCAGQDQPSSAREDAPPAIEFRARILDTRCNGRHNEFFMSNDGSFAVSVEPQSEATARYALWNLTEGKLVRYLAAKEGAGVKAYGGDEDGDVGVETKFSQRRVQRIIFAPGGGLIAALTQTAAPDPGPQKVLEEILVWEASTGELERRVNTNRGHHHHTFFFVDPRHIVTKAFSQAGVSLELIDLSTGTVDFLIKDVNFEMYGGSVSDGWLPFLAPGGQMFSINWRTRQQIVYEKTPPGTSRYAPDRTWYSADGKYLYARAHGDLQVWDARTKKFDRETRLADDEPSDLLLVADDAGLVARRRRGEPKLELIDVTTNQTAATLVLPYRRIALAGMSQDARRLAIPTENRQMLLLDFPDGAPTGDILVGPAAITAQKEVLR